MIRIVRTSALKMCNINTNILNNVPFSLAENNLGIFLISLLSCFLYNFPLFCLFLGWGGVGCGGQVGGGGVL